MLFHNYSPFGKQYARLRKRTHQAMERSLGTPPEQFGNSPFEGFINPDRAGRDDDFALSEPTPVNGECAGS
jgi:hypothetical protein